MAGDGLGCGEAMCGVLWVPTCDQTCSAPTSVTPSYASATMGGFSSGYTGSTSVRGESVSFGGLSQQVDGSGCCQGNHKQDNYSGPGFSVCEIWNTQEIAN